MRCCGRGSWLCALGCCSGASCFFPLAGVVVGSVGEGGALGGRACAEVGQSEGVPGA